MQKNNLTIKLDHGAGGFASWELLKKIRGILKFKGDWTNCEDDGAVFDLGKEKLVFTTDAFIVDPIFFPGGDIGKIAMSGTINDLAVMGAKPLGISLSMVIEEGFPQKDLMKIIKSIDQVSRESGVPVVTGDTKVMEKGKLDKIEITTAGVGITKKIIRNNGAQVGDFIIASGDLGEHSIALLSKRFNYQTKIKSDGQPLNKILEEVGQYLNVCKDPTRGGLAANIVEIANKSKVKIILDEKNLPYKKETIAVSELLGIDIFSLASEGRFIASVSAVNIKKVLEILKQFNDEALKDRKLPTGQAKIIGEVKKGKGVFLKTKTGGVRSIDMPTGKLIPRIC
ncbi:MAG: hydrogenase expression/formation protein HypE [bacterium]|nr:hydrogenase expression/formation protein HypE [bacterium]